MGGLSEQGCLWSTPRWTGVRSGPVGPTCPKCQTIHVGTDVIAVGRFDLTRPTGYMPRIGGCGCVYRTREEAMAVVCASRAEARL